jgi:hypothetical protein
MCVRGGGSTLLHVCSFARISFLHTFTHTQGTVVNLTFEKAEGSSVSINLLRGGPEYISKVCVYTYTYLFAYEKM